MLSIGDFARLVGVSVRMLRHYDQLGLLTPSRVDEFSGYRYYGIEQLDRANQLVALKALGFTLEQVGVMLNEKSAAQLAHMLKAREAALRRQISADQHRLHQIEARLRLISTEHTMSDRTYTESSLPALRLVQLSARISEMSEIEAEIGPMFERVNAAIAAAGLIRTGPGVAHYTSDGDTMIAAAAEQIGDAAAPDGLEPASLVAAPRALTTQFVAPDLIGIQQAWQALVTEVERRGLQPTGTAREIYLQTPYDPNGNGWVIDLQQPVA